MKSILVVAVSAALLFVPALAGTAGAAGPDQDSGPGDDLGVQLADMFAAMADALAARQDQVANESHLGSAANANRLRAAILRAPDVSVRGARPFVEGLVIGED